MRVVIVRADVDDHEIGSRMLFEIPFLGLLAEKLGGTPGGIGGFVPLVGVATRVAPAFSVDEADTWISSDAEFGVAETVASVEGKAGHGLVGGVHACAEGVTDEFDGARMVGDLDETGLFGDVDSGDLNLKSPIGSVEFKSEGQLGGQGLIEAWCFGGDELVRAARSYIGELPVLAIESVADKNAWRGVFAKCYGYFLACEAKLDTRSSAIC